MTKECPTAVIAGGISDKLTYYLKEDEDVIFHSQSSGSIILNI